MRISDWSSDVCSSDLREGADAQALLRESLGWDVPLVALSAWVRGMRADGPAQMQFDDRGLPEVLEQQGWRVEFRAWSNDGSLPMPRRPFARRADAKDRLVIDPWIDRSAPPLVQPRTAERRAGDECVSPAK